MRSGTQSVAAAALAIGMASLPFAIPASAQNPQNAQNTGRTESALVASAVKAAMVPAQVQAVHSLFARATDVALLPDGVTGLQSMIAAQTQTPAAQTTNTAPTTPANTAPPSGTNGGQAGTSNTQRTSSQASRTARALSPAGTNVGRDSDSRKLNQLVGQIRQQWRQKYHQDFRINNEAKVYADITASDIGRGQAQTASSRVPARPTTNPSTPPVASNASPAPIDVSVPAVSNAKTVHVQVVPGAGQTYEFASEAAIDRQQLSRNLQKHLQEVEQHQSQWPSDVNQAYRLVTQHVLMAIAESTGTPEQNAIPAGDHQAASGASHVQGLRGERAPAGNPNAPSSNR